MRIWRNLVGGVFSWLLAAIVGIGLHAQPDCVAIAGFHNKVSSRAIGSHAHLHLQYTCGYGEPDEERTAHGVYHSLDETGSATECKHTDLVHN